MDKKIIASIVIMLFFTAFSVFAASSMSHEGMIVEKIEELDNETRAEQMIETMSLERKVAQMFMGCFYSYTPSVDTVQQSGLGGVLLFKPSFADTPPEELASHIGNLDYLCDIPPITAVDEEGGDVVRVSASSLYRDKPFKSPRELFTEGGIDAVVMEAHERNLLLDSLGIDMNLAPVCDIATNPDDFMYRRSLGQDPDTTGDFVKAVVNVCEEDDIACCLKHFPGYGPAVDTHIQSAFDTRSMDELLMNDLVPFGDGIEADVPAILVSHNTVNSIDNNLPASLSPAVHQLLREDMGFDGVIVSDDLIMGAVTEYGSPEEVAVAAVKAGNDILCTGNYAIQIDAVVDAVKSGVIDESRIDESVKRILMMKFKYDIML